MRHLMICISGWAGTGKDECAGQLVKAHSAIHTGLADPGKRHGLDTYKFTVEQLWGPSKFRNEGDPRYPKPIMKEFGFKKIADRTWMAVVDASNRDEMFLKGKGYMGAALQFMEAAIRVSRTGQSQTVVVQDTDPAWFLSPREYLQLYLELCNALYADTWIDKGIEDHRLLASEPIGDYSYSRERGVYPTPSDGIPTVEPDLVVTCYSDFRHIHEHRGARGASDGTLVPVLIRVKRPTVTRPPFKHRSETEQTRIRDAAYDFVVDNSSTLDHLYGTIDNIVATCSSPSWSGKAWSEDFVLPFEQETYVS